MITQNGPIVLMDVAANRPAATGVPKIGTMFFATDSGVLSILKIVAGVKTWVSIGGGTTTLPVYWVAPVNSNPAAPFNLLSTAIAQWNTDKANGLVPGPILMAPGTYVEPNPVMMPAGIDIIGMGATVNYFPNQNTLPAIGVDVIISGTINHSPTGSGQASMTGIAVNGGGNFAFNYNPPSGSPQLVLQRCLFFSGAPALGAFGSASGTANAVLEMTECFIQNTNPANGAAFQCSAPLKIVATRCDFIGQALGNGAISTAGGTHDYQQCVIAGSNMDSSTASRTFRGCESTTASPQANVGMVAGSSVTWLDGSLTGGAAGGTFGGGAPGGNLTIGGNIRTDANGITAAAGITVSIQRSRKQQTSRDNGAANLVAANVPLADVHTLDTSGSPRSVALPQGSTVLPGDEFIFCAKVGGGNAITVNPNGAETIAGVAAGIATSATTHANMRVQRDPQSATNWNVLGYG